MDGFLFVEIMEFGMKWVHMVRYGLILKLDGALWLTIIFRPPPDPKKCYENQHVLDS